MITSGGRGRGAVGDLPDHRAGQASGRRSTWPSPTSPARTCPSTCAGPSCLPITRCRW